MRLPKGASMTPEDVFGDRIPQEWITDLCRSLIRRKDRVKQVLIGKSSYHDFCREIAVWRESIATVDDDLKKVEQVARELFFICDRFGLIEPMGLSVRPVPTLGESGGLRTRGGAGDSLRTAIGELRKVSELFPAQT